MKFVLSLIALFAVCLVVDAGNYGVAVQQAPAVQAAPVCQSCQPAVQAAPQILQAPQVYMQPQILQQQYAAPVQQQFIQRQTIGYNAVVQQAPIVVRQVVRQRVFAAPVVHHTPALQQRVFVGRSAFVGSGRSVFVGGGLFRPRVLVNF